MRRLWNSRIMSVCNWRFEFSSFFFFYFIFFYFSVAVRSASALDSTIRGVVGRRFHKRVLVLTGFYFIFFFLIGLEGI